MYPNADRSNVSFTYTMISTALIVGILTFESQGVLSEIGVPQRNPASASFMNISASQSTVHESVALEIFLSLMQAFGSVSLLEYIGEMYIIAHDIKLVAYIGFSLICSIIIIEILHSTGGILEIFQGEYSRSWAVLGIDWTAGFVGTLSVMIVTASTNIEARPSYPIGALVAVAGETSLLVYILRCRGKQGCEHLVAMLLTFGLMLGILLAVINENDWDRLCDDECTNLCGGECFYSKAYPDQDGEFFCSPVNTSVYRRKDSITILVSVAAASILWTGGNFVAVLLASRGHNKMTCLLVGISWVVTYPFYEFARLVPRVLDLIGSLNLKQYTFLEDGTISNSSRGLTRS